MPEPANIRKIYRNAGQLKNMPEGKGINTAAFHHCVVSYLNKGFSYKEAAKRCVGGLGKNAFNKSHQRKG
jgi:hypothetical protein